MQTILGAGGPVGNELAKALREYTSQIRLVSRNPEKVNEQDELLKADLLLPAQVKAAVQGSDTVYFTAGLKYNHHTWQKEWPLIVSNVIDACEEFDAKMVFFDNVYMYDKKSSGQMKENTPVMPPSKKGLVRARIAEMVMKEVWTGKLTALIARSADFYGPGIKSNSLLNEMVFKPLAKGKKALWLGSAGKKHSFTYVPDAARATALLGNTPAAYGQVWHLPTAEDPPTGKEWIESIAAEMNTRPQYRVISKSMLRVLGLFMPVMKETIEMIYQYEQDYVFNSRKIQEEFTLEPTPYLRGIREVVKVDFPERRK